jgi:hypothetical protein
MNAEQTLLNLERPVGRPLLDSRGVEFYQNVLLDAGLMLPPVAAIVSPRQTCLGHKDSNRARVREDEHLVNRQSTFAHAASSFGAAVGLLAGAALQLIGGEWAPDLRD